MKGEDGVNDVTHDKWLEMFNRGLARIKEELLVEQVDGQFFDAKVLPRDKLFRKWDKGIHRLYIPP